MAELKEELKEARDLTKKPVSSGFCVNDPTEDRVSSKTLSITIPESPPPEKEDNYPSIRFWHKEEWTAYESKAKNRNQQLDKLYFLCDEEGEIISQARRDEMTETVKMAFNKLYYWRLDPHTWKKVIAHTLQYFSATMHAKFPEFQWCSGDWKVQEFAKIRYPDWACHYREPGELTCECYLYLSINVITLTANRCKAVNWQT